MTDILLSDEFVYTVNNYDYIVTVWLTRSGLLICDGKEQHSYRLKYIHLHDIIGVKAHYGDKDTVFLLIYSFPLVKNRFNGKTQRCKKVAMLCASQHNCTPGNLKQAMLWKNTITSCLRSSFYKVGDVPLTTHRLYLVFINPKGGKGIAKKLWLNSVRPMFDIASIEYKEVYTEYSGHARDYVIKDPDLFKYDSIVTISGDGIVFEVFNGLLKREDSAKAIKIPLSVIPGGSGNGLCASILHQCGIPITLMDAIFVAIRGVSTPLDLVKVEQGDEVMWSFLSIAWGLLSAVDIESEKMRWLGEARFTVEAVKKLLSFPIKSGKVWFVKAEDTNIEKLSRSSSFCSTSSSEFLPKFKPTIRRKMEKEPVPASALRHRSSLQPTTKTNSPGSSNSSDTHVEEAPLDPQIDFTTLNDVDHDTDGEGSIDMSKMRGRCISEMNNYPDPEVELACICDKCNPPDSKVISHDISRGIEKLGLHDSLPSSWTMVAGDFGTVMAFSLTHLSLGYQISECLRLNAGYFYLMFTRDRNYKDFLQILLQNVTPESNESKTINFEKIKAFRLEPEVSEKGAYVTVDGELVPYKPLHACIHKGIARVMCLPTQN